MLCLIIKSLVLPQQLQKGYAARHEQQVGSQNHQQNRHKKHHHGSYGVLGGYRDCISSSQKAKPQQCQQPFGLGFLLPHVPRPQQFYGVNPANLPDRMNVDQCKNRNEYAHRVHYSLTGDKKSQRHFPAGDSEHHQKHRLVQSHPKHDSQKQPCQCHIHCLPPRHSSQMSSFHAQNVEQSELLLPALHQEAAGIEQKYNGENTYHGTAQCQYIVDKTPPYDIVQSRIAGQGAHNVKYSHRDDAG